MTCTIVVGGQFGSEGKGKVVTLMALQARAPWVVRCGGPNSGHTTMVGGKDIVLRQVPCGVANSNATLAIAAASVIDEALLFEEIDALKLERDRLVVDPRAVLLDDGDRTSEDQVAVVIGSTASGTGSALIRRMRRGFDVRLASSSILLRDRVRLESVAPRLHSAVDRGADVIVEGTQGFGLSLFHGGEYPYLTARDTTAAAFASEVGLSPRHVDRVCVVIRTFPIRVGGNSGPLPDEIDWETVRSLSGAPAIVPEFTSVTRRIRRVGHFDLNAIVAACQYNGATELAVMGLDRLDYLNTGASQLADISLAGRCFLRELRQATGIPVNWVGTNFDTKGAFSLDASLPDSVLDRDVAR